MSLLLLPMLPSLVRLTANPLFRMTFYLDRLSNPLLELHKSLHLRAPECLRTGSVGLSRTSIST